MTLAAICLLAVMPLAAAQSLEFSDATGDATVQGVPVPGLDVLGGSVSLDNSSLVFTVNIDDAAAAQRGTLAALVAWEFWVEARYRGDTFHFVIETGLGEVPDPQAGPTDTTTAGIYRVTDDGFFDKLYGGAGDVDGATNTYAAVFPVNEIEARDGFILGPGEPLEFTEVVSYFDEGPGSPHDFSRGNAIMPQQVLMGGDHAEFPPNSYLTLPGSTTELTLSTPRPIRFSNGEATTYHWPISITNPLASAVEVELDADADDDLDLRLPAGLRLDAGESRIVSVYATAPFQHRHGGQRDVLFTARTGAIQASLPLAIHYLDVPQPAGHHPNVYLHALNAGAGSAAVVWIDTLSEPIQGSDANMLLGAMSCRKDDTDIQLSNGLFAPLDPVRQIGIDANVDQAAHFTGRLVVPGVMPSGQLIMKLLTYDPVAGDGPGSLSPSEENIVSFPVPLTRAGALDVEIDLPIPAELDYLLPTDPRNLALALVFCGDAVAGPSLPRDDVQPYFEHGAFMTLPFNEYHDVIELDSGTGPRLTVENPRPSAPPGSTVTWSIALEGPGTYSMHLFGVDHNQAKLLNSQASAGDKIFVSLDVPEDAQDGDILEVVLSAEDASDATVSAAIRLAVLVDQDAEAQAMVSESTNPTPGPQLGLLLLGLLAVGMASKKRQ